MNNKSLLTLSNIESGYGPIKVLHGVSLEADKKDIVALIGPNGAGKKSCFVRGKGNFGKERDKGGVSGALTPSP